MPTANSRLLEFAQESGQYLCGLRFHEPLVQLLDVLHVNLQPVASIHIYTPAKTVLTFASPGTSNHAKPLLHHTNSASSSHWLFAAPNRASASLVQYRTTRAPEACRCRNLNGYPHYYPIWG